MPASGEREPLRLLPREIGLMGAMMMGLGSIIGTGVFVSIGIAAGVAGPSVLLALVVAAGVAMCNGLSSAQLAASNPVSGGTYEYGYRYLTPSLGFLAGWTFLCAKGASAATAALGLAGYLLNTLGASGPEWRVPTALAAIALLTGIVRMGIRQSNVTNILIVSVTLFSLCFFVAAGLPTALASGSAHLRPFWSSSNTSPSFLEACALMFVTYTGYGRIATLGEEILEPRRTIPRCILLTLSLSMVLYLAVAGVGVASVGAEAFAAAGQETAAPLEVVSRQFAVPGAEMVLAVGAVTAMLGVLLNLILGLSRVLLAMGRRSDMPLIVSRLDGTGRTPTAAVLLVGGVVAGLVLIGDVKTTWSFSAFTVLIYYALTNLCALRMKASERLHPRIVPMMGLAASLFLAFWVPTNIWIAGLVLLVLGLLWHLARRTISPLIPPQPPSSGSASARPRTALAQSKPPPDTRARRRPSRRRGRGSLGRS
jgi:APA family basic amino acid/polyamine antiporter